MFFIIYQQSDYRALFWYCNHAALLFGVAFLIDNIDIVKALINIGFLPQLFWVIDFFSKVLFNTYVFNVTDYVFNDTTYLSALVISFNHIFLIGVALYTTYKYKTSNKSVWYSFMYIMILFIITMLFTNPIDNANCVQYFCAYPLITGLFYRVLWPILAFSLMVLPTYYIQHLLYKWSQKP